jgi:hypothetical protein
MESHKKVELIYNLHLSVIAIFDKDGGKGKN